MLDKFFFSAKRKFLSTQQSILGFFGCFATHLLLKFENLKSSKLFWGFFYHLLDVVSALAASLEDVGLISTRTLNVHLLFLDFLLICRTLQIAGNRKLHYFFKLSNQGILFTGGRR
jgi:hypothetical protein